MVDSWSLRLVVVALLVAICGCSEPSDQSAGLVVNVRAERHTDNELRFDVSVELDRSASLCIEFWRRSDPSKVRRSAVSKSLVSHCVTLVVLEPETAYNFRVVVEGQVQSPIYEFATRSIPAELMRFENKIGHSDCRFDGYIHLASKIKGMLYLINDRGRVVWYQSTPEVGVICSNYDPKTNTFQAITGYRGDRDFCGLRLYEVDIYGNQTMNIPYSELENSAVHHDIYKTATGNYAVINFLDSRFDLSHWGGDVDESVVGDGFTVVDKDGHTLWQWSCFDHISPVDDPNIMGDKGEYEVTPREDWLHANSLVEDADGYFYVTFNKLNQIWKIAPNSGQVVYKLGRGGDFSLPTSTDPQHLHAVSVPNKNRVMVLDNGALRGQSRALAYDIDASGSGARVSLDVMLPREDFSRNQSSVYMMSPSRILFGSSVAQTIVITDLQGQPMWRYAASEQFFRAIYIEHDKLNNI